MFAAAAHISASAPRPTAARPEGGSTMPDSSPTPRLDRRGFLKAGAAFGGGLVLTFAVPPVARPAWAAAAASPGFAPNAFIRIDRRGAVTLVMPMVEMGQGVYTAQAMLLA